MARRRAAGPVTRGGWGGPSPRPAETKDPPTPLPEHKGIGKGRGAPGGRPRPEVPPPPPPAPPRHRRGAGDDARRPPLADQHRGRQSPARTAAARQAHRRLVPRTTPIRATP